MPEAINENGNCLRLRIGLCAVAVVLGGLHAASARHFMNPDGISYLDMGDAYMRGDWGTAINGLWSPFYSWLTGLAMLLFKPTLYREVPLVHFVNFIIYLSAVASFDIFLRELIRLQRQRRDAAGEAGRKPLPAWAWTTLGYALFMWTSLHLIGLAAVTPDMCLAAFVYLAAAVLLRIRRGHESRLTFVMLGVTLGFGYLAKASMFPPAFVFLACGVLSAASPRKALACGILALCVFLCVGSIYFVPLSLAKGRLTFGESGMLNYSWYVNKTTLHIHWRGEPTGGGTPLHPTRKISDAPAAYEFRTPIRATYPPWYDPSYWYEGAGARFDPAGQFRVLRANLAVLYDLLFTGAQAVWMAGFLILFGVSCKGRSCIGNVARQWNLLLPSLSVIGMYALVHVEARYLGVSVVLLALGLFSGVLLPVGRASRRLAACIVIVVASVIIISLIPSSVKAARALSYDLTYGEEKSAAPHRRVAESLKAAGVRPGDEVASVGYAFNALWARLARVQIVAEVTSGSLEAPAPDARMFWTSDPSAQTRIIDLFAHAGAKAVVADKVPPGAATDGWHRVGDTDYYIYIIDK